LQTTLIPLTTQDINNELLGQISVQPYFALSPVNHILTIYLPTKHSMGAKCFNIVYWLSFEDP